MSDPIYMHRYSLQSKSLLNSQSKRRSFDGILLRIGDGVGCVHPWVELGDPSVDQLIASLQIEDFRSPLLRNAMHCAQIDAEARNKGVSLFDGLSVPESHATITVGEEQVEAAVRQGFKVVKLKLGPNIDLEMLEMLHARHPNLRWRFDFNQSLDEAKLLAFLLSLSASLVEQIDFVEDPCDRRVDMKKCSVPIAIDKGVEMCDSSYQYAVVKPAVDDVTQVCERAQSLGLKGVFTSYMDHPVGQSYAAWMAGTANALYSQLEMVECGLMTQGLFEENAFIEALGPIGPKWNAADGVGLGFDSLLDELDWKRVK
ncbi:enolase C-terminal domain-like protein [Rubritalea spongiae]|uniref:Enolase C-terminal domain-like protein n=1 Tax=Rubritalea spongiae TaxID=430797 RepID=A0ABW5E982_9BACT